MGGVPLEINDNCFYCGTCVNVCPRNALELIDSGSVEIDGDRCMEYICRRMRCGLCAKVCPVGAIKID